ncbi:hypothetical protein C8F01DRAFT_1081046 [Mycena amicta]|nr:hypothetical protein C8F01DRAFT_1081046 [Mycena amicta]
MLSPPRGKSSLPAFLLDSAGGPMRHDMYSDSQLHVFSLKIRDRELPPLPNESHKVEEHAPSRLRHSFSSPSLNQPTAHKVILPGRPRCTTDPQRGFHDEDSMYSERSSMSSSRSAVSQDDLLNSSEMDLNETSNSPPSLCEKASPRTRRGLGMPCLSNFMAMVQTTATTTRIVKQGNDSTVNSIRSAPFMRSDAEDPTAGVLVTIHQHQVISEPFEAASSKSAASLLAIPNVSRVVSREKPLPIPIDILVDVSLEDGSEPESPAECPNVDADCIPEAPRFPLRTPNPHVARLKNGGKRRKHYKPHRVDLACG